MTDDMFDPETADTDRPVVRDPGVIDVPPPEEREPPPPELVEAVTQYFMTKRDDLNRKVANIETLLGFVTQGDDDAMLAARVAKLERFCGIKG